MLVNQTETPLYIKVNEKDNTAIIVNAGGLPKGTVFPCGLKLQERIPQGHKVALTNITQGGAVIRYGEVIGYAVKPIEKAGGFPSRISCFRKLRRSMNCPSPTSSKTRSPS